MRRLSVSMLTLAALVSIALGVLSVRLPYVHAIAPVLNSTPGLNSAPALEAVPATIRWGWFAFNAFLGFLLIANGAVTALLALRGRAAAGPGSWFLMTNCAFWALVTLYSLCCLLPEPQDMPWLREAFQGTAASMLLLHAAPLLLQSGRPVPKAPSPAPTA